MIYITLPSKTGDVAWRASVYRRKFHPAVSDCAKRSAAGRSTLEVLRRGQGCDLLSQLTENWTVVRSGNANRPLIVSVKCSRFNDFTRVLELDSGLRSGRACARF